VRESLAKTGAVPMMDFEDEGEIQIPVFDQRAEKRQMHEPASTFNPYYNPFTAKPRQGGAAGSEASGFDAALESFMAPYPTSQESELEREFDSSIMEFIEGGEAVEEAADQELGLNHSADYFKGAVTLAGGYVATSLGGRLAIVDLARAREVLLFRRYMAMIGSGASVGQALLFAERMVLSADDVELMSLQRDKFVAFGFDFAVVDSNTVEFTSLPADVERSAIEDVVYDMLDSLRDGIGVSERQRKERLAAILSRNRGVKALSEGEVEAVLDSLEGCRECSLTYDGRPVVRLVEPADIKALFLN
jgi:DNA mismatch repair protein MutL